MPHSSFEDFDFAGRTKAEYEKARRELKRPNILVCGGTGAGKSTLINLTLNDDDIRAKVDAGRPVTQDIAKYEGELVTVYDSPGYESGEESQRRYKDVVLKLMFDNKNSVSNRIHMAWYCISQGNDRVLDIDIQTINDIVKTKVPVAVVLTQADKGTEDGAGKLKALLREECLGVEVFEISTDASLNLGVDTLLAWTAQHLEESVRIAFLSAAKGAIEEKLAAGRTITLQHIATATTIAASPIPFSDAPLLLANQTALVARLASLWDLASVKAAISSALPGQVISTIGRSLAGNLVKMVPGGGSIIGAGINAGIASAMTAGIGYGINELFAKMKKDELEGKTLDLSSYFSQLPDLIDLFKQKQAGGK